MKQQIVYIRAYKKTTIQQTDIVYLKDIADIYTSLEMKNHVDSLEILRIKDPTKKSKYLMGIIDIIKIITAAYPDVVIQNVGDADMLIDYLPKIVKQNTMLEWIKTIVVSIIVFAGATIAIMAYSADTSLGKTFSLLNKIFTGKEVDNPVMITIPYSIGIAIGIITFFNHIGNKKITDDPTPMQIEINKYEEDVEDSMIDSMTSNKRGEP
ncbi:MAG: stage sporulation protein [Clostridia bacterium]|jgi:stage V sporulation protein AA|nr:stage sporulation protein [Clostridia bacterium]